MFLFLTTVATLSLSPADPLELARDGMALCYEPDPTRQTCYGMATYRWPADGTIMSDIVVAAAATPRVLLHSSAPVFVRDGAECTRLVPSWSQITAITYDGERLTGADFESTRRIFGSIIDRSTGPGSELCFTYRALPEGGIESVATVDGVARPDLGGPVLWVRPSDGWQVAY